MRLTSEESLRRRAILSTLPRRLRALTTHSHLRHLRALSVVALAWAAGCGSKDNGSGNSGNGADAGPQVACATRSGMRGKTTRTLMVDGKARTYVAYLPETLDATKQVPLVFVFHGATMTGEEMFDITGFSALADSEGFAVVFPDGQGSSSVTGAGVLDPWNVFDKGQSVCGAGDLANNTNAVDFDFLDAIKADILDDQCLDAQHEFATGFSMGGYFSHHVGCDRTDIRAVAPGSGGTIPSLTGCATGHVPIIIFHGTSDPLIVPGCDDPNSPAQSGFPASATLWAQKNGCGTTYTTMPIGGDAGSNGQCYVYDGCPADGQVELCTFNGMGHCWAGGSNSGSGATYGCPAYPSATQLTWDFWKQHAW
jgi:polyhydroxybutyrate depolymerase